MTPRIFTMDSFGADCPDNWEAVADFLEAALDQYGYDYRDDFEDVRDTANMLWDAFCNEHLETVCSTAVYGRDMTSLRLSKKAEECYNGIDPCMIVEYSVDGHYLYQYTVSGETSYYMTEDELNEAFESMYDEWALDVIEEDDVSC